MAEKYKTSKEILSDLEKISPLEISNYLIKCEFYDESDALETLEKAEEKFKKEGGVAGAMMDTLLRTTADAIGLCLIRYTNEGLYRKLVKTRSTEFSKCIDDALHFQYDKAFLELNSNSVNDSLKQDYLRRGITRHPGDGSMPQIDVRDGGYAGGKDYRSNGMNRDFMNRQSADGKAVTTSDGKKLFIHKDDADGKRNKVAEADHIIPLETIHNNSKYFIERYVDLDIKDDSGRSKLQLIVNDDKNFQVLAGNKNASKGGNQNNLQYIQTCEKVHKAADLYKKMETASPAEKLRITKEIKELGLNDNRRKDARKIADGTMSETEKDKYNLSDEQKDELKRNHESAKAHLNKSLLAEGTKTVLWEQLGKVIKMFIGPIGYELRDSIKNGITHGFDDCNSFEAFCKRIWRAIKYTLSKLKELLGEFLTDLTKMVGVFFANACKLLQKIFGKFLDLVLSSVSIVIESVKILMSDVSATSKGDAILKLIIGFVSGVLGNMAIDYLLESLGIPDPFADIVAAVSSAVIGGVVMQIYEKLDIFGTKKELRKQRIKEFFELRRQKLLEAGEQFDMVVSQKLKMQRQQMENIKTRLNDAIDNHNFEMMDSVADEALNFFNVKVPYSNSDEFVNFLFANDMKIKIS